MVVKQLINHQFPSVESISTNTVATWLASELPPPILIDARKSEEYAISHLPGAYNWPSLAAVQQSAVSPEAKIVVYCSVGYRSARLAQQLQEAGYTHVVNLEGSIFEWHNQGYPLIVDGKPTQAIHPYNWVLGRLLEPPASVVQRYKP